jgi:hypothetical protein
VEKTIVNGDPVATTARAAARHLSRRYGPRLELDTDAALQAHQPRAEPARRYADPVAVASLLVSVASLAWQIYSDRNSQTNKPTAQWLARTLRVEHRKQQRDISEAEEEIIEVIAVEIIKAGGDDELPLAAR